MESMEKVNIKEDNSFIQLSTSIEMTSYKNRNVKTNTYFAHALQHTDGGDYYPSILFVHIQLHVS